MADASEHPGEDIVCAWIRSDACGVGLKMMLDRGSVQPLMDAISGALAEMRARADAAEARVGVLEEALVPFARWADLHKPGPGLRHADEDSFCTVHGGEGWSARLTIGDLRRAARVVDGGRTC